MQVVWLQDLHPHPPLKMNVIKFHINLTDISNNMTHWEQMVLLNIKRLPYKFTITLKITFLKPNAFAKTYALNNAIVFIAPFFIKLRQTSLLTTRTVPLQFWSRIPKSLLLNLARNFASKFTLSVTNWSQPVLGPCIYGMNSVNMHK